MRLMTKFLSICFLSLGLESSSYIYIEEGVKLPLDNQGVVLFNGAPAKVLSSDSSKMKIIVSGFVSGNSLFATKNLKLLLATVQNKKSIKISGNKGAVEVFIPKKNITDNADDAWEENSDLFYDKCTKCHAAKTVGEHTMLEWDALFGSMKTRAQISENDEKIILRFLRAFSKDGILKESD